MDSSDGSTLKLALMGKTSSFRANLQGAWDDRENARLGLAAATLQSDMEKAGELVAAPG